ncbi:MULTISPECIES: ATP-binding protein [unclassified Fusibacter]|uniref:ATP-binding protein n=1 Tax=unclassified Fusibacter TaxID=2624464 RepID=UPI00101269ED|nr:MULTISPECIES: ATP-binding protein [unclassified Fusibacter]MCK8061269.1 putative DNA binding domain-containing protein [Fusibacter sp. A2]NPE23901.1 AAA family ATPase [Fusibacter sp. A1]RXV58097.1 AAA family ATPase [Fusibacter sp. A1]
MLEDELVQLVQKITFEKCEKQHIELKKALGGTPSKLYDTLSSFSNQTGGGIIVFGIDEEDDYKVVGVYDAQDLQKKVMEQSLQMEPVVRPLFTVAQVEDKVVVSAEISEFDIYDKPCFYKGAGRLRGSYIRVGDSDQPMTEYEIYSYEAYKRRIHDELRSVERATMEYLKKDNITEYLIKLRRLKMNLANLEDKRILETQGLCQDGFPTLAGLMLLGEYPQEFTPQLSVTAMVVQGKEIGELGEDGERFVDNKRIEGTISQMLEGTLAFVRRNMKVKTIVTEEGTRADKPEYPIKAIREIILNALIHRDYSVHTERSPIRLIMYEDRLELENPGGLYGRITVDNLGKAAADTRNPYLAGALEIMVDTENRFSGIPTVIAELKKAGMPHPVFIDQRGVFKVIFYKKTVVQDKDIDFENEIINYCITPRTREELAEKFGFEAPSYFIKTYIYPLIDSGKMKMTIPNKPKSKFQKYYS